MIFVRGSYAFLLQNRLVIFFSSRFASIPCLASLFLMVLLWAPPPHPPLSARSPPSTSWSTLPPSPPPPLLARSAPPLSTNHQSSLRRALSCEIWRGDGRSDKRTPNPRDLDMTPWGSAESASSSSTTGSPPPAPSFCCLRRPLPWFDIIHLWGLAVLALGAMKAARPRVGAPPCWLSLTTIFDHQLRHIQRIN